MHSNQNATKRNIISFTIVFAIAMITISIQNAQEQNLNIKERLEASIPQSDLLLTKE